MFNSTEDTVAMRVIREAGFPETDDWDHIVHTGRTMGLDVRSASDPAGAVTSSAQHHVVIILDGKGHLCAGNSSTSQLNAFADALETYATIPVYRRGPSKRHYVERTPVSAAAGAIDQA